MFDLIFYETEDGKLPVSDLLKTLEPKLHARVISYLEILEEKGNELRMPYTKHLDDGIFELRVSQGSNIVRILFFFLPQRQIIVTNGFVKKQQKTPAKEILLAKETRDDYLLRCYKGGTRPC